MNRSFNRFESRLQRLIEESTARLFSAKDAKGQLAASLIEAMQREVQFGEADNLIAPGIYTIQASAEHATELKANQSLLDELKQDLLSAASEAGVALSCAPVLHVAPQEDLAPGEFRVRCAGLGKNLSQTQGLRALPENGEHQVPQGAFLIVNGTEIFTLSLPIINIGRKKDNDLVIDNPGVSRRHAQLRAIAGSFHFFDLGSTGGSKVNDQDVKTATLLAGDVISLAGVPLIYGQDSGKSPAETQEYRPTPNA